MTRKLTELDLLDGDEAFRLASFGPRQVTPYGIINPQACGHVLDRDGDHVVEQSITDELIAWMRDRPGTFAPANPYYRKTHVNARGTVRQWFRAMRAADFARDLPPCWKNPLIRLKGIDYGWTLFDTMKVVDRITESGTCRRERGADGLTQVNLRDAPDGPCLSRRGIMPEDLDTFMRDDERRRCGVIGQPEWDNTDYSRDVAWLGIDRGSSLAFTLKPAPPDPTPVCSRCHGPVRFTGAPLGYVGPCSGSLLYHYAKLLEPDLRYLTPKPEVWMCDACQHAGVL
jgi:hypothetical protein